MKEKLLLSIGQVNFLTSKKGFSLWLKKEREKKKEKKYVMR